MAERGRPTKRTPEVEAEILGRLADGETLTSICRAEHMPERRTVLRWRREDPDFRDKYTQARLEGMESMADGLLDIADDGTNDYMRANDPDNAGYAYNGEAVARSRLRVDTRRFLMAKIAPRMFGEALALTGPDGGPIKTEDVTDPKVLAQKMAFLLASHLQQDEAEGE